MTGLFTLALLVLAGAVIRLHHRLKTVERRADLLEGLLDRLTRHATPAILTEAPATPADWTFPRESETQSAPDEPPTPAPPEAPPEPRLDLETLIAGRLPIWIGGAALVLAGFFLVRYSIESGLLGPGVRTLLAALFAAALIAASEAARRVPATADDPRIAQVLAGAGVASAYGTLYMAAALYDLIGALTAFILMLGVTVAALGLALRHGPPTAVMALIGGFVAPLVAGFEAAGVGPLLVYLGLFVAALFGLAIRRGWAWLALAATASAFAWINLLLVLLAPAQLPAIGLFTVALAIGATLALPATGTRSPWLILLPLIAGLIQLVAVAPVLDFSAFAWSFYLILSAAALALAWRDDRLILAAVAAPLLILFLLTGALLQPAPGLAPQVAILATFLFAATGHAFAGRHRLWPLVAVIGTAGPWLTALACRSALLSKAGWLITGLALAAASAALAWRRRSHRDEADLGLILATAFAAILALAALGAVLPLAWLPVTAALAMAALAWWAERTPDRHLAKLPAAAFALAVVAALEPLASWALATAAALAGTALIFPLLPTAGDALRGFAIPAAVAIALLAWRPAAFASRRREVAAVATLLALAALHVLAKQIFAIATPEAFLAHGFLERALVTQALLAAAWALRRTDRLPRLAAALTVVAIVRLVWFDLLAFNPAITPQSVGPLPIANLAVAHFALAAFWLWTMPSTRPIRLAAAAFTLAAGLALVRQLAHGSILTGPIGIAENWGYSAVPLAIGIAWLWRGIAAEKTDLRALGIALLTAVTLKVFLLDAARLDGFLRVLSFLGLGLALIGIGALYGRFLRRPRV